MTNKNEREGETQAQAFLYVIQRYVCNREVSLDAMCSARGRDDIGRRSNFVGDRSIFRWRF